MKYGIAGILLSVIGLILLYSGYWEALLIAPVVAIFWMLADSTSGDTSSW